MMEFSDEFQMLTQEKTSYYVGAFRSLLRHTELQVFTLKVIVPHAPSLIVGATSDSVQNELVPHTPTSIVDATSDSVLALEAAKDQLIVAEEKSKQDTSFSSKGNVGQGSPKSISEQRAFMGNTPSISHKTLVSSKETPSTSNQVSTNSVLASCGIRKNLSSSNLLTNRFSSLSSDDEDESLVSDEELDPKENLSPAGRVFLRDRPVKPSTKAKEMRSHQVARGRGNRNRGRGKRGGRG
ncbi:hypothetical protein DY000_02061506 [Brassica cretica]|uniref:Uncharacterized protein n=1 Tax=Brassica cretica TaxID=69181 RepID=A0ABQ7AP14_BRACR|nr:hypothetical protein DY000_02061506 [Brassica cretica]